MNSFSSLLLQWYLSHQRLLPWRAGNIDPYHVVVSEFMLQQTQVSRVTQKYVEFLQQFPAIHDLAHATKADVIQAWSGLGYNRRALLLHQFAQQVVQNHQGVIPEDKAVLQNLSGMGPYMTGAVLSFAFNRSVPAIDVNVRRVFLRFFHGKDQGKPLPRKEEQQLYHLVQQTIPKQRSREFHNALMDFGSLVCTREPKCTTCPLNNACVFFPLYTTQKEKVLFVAEKKHEKGAYEHGKYIPNRIFRGRILQWVRNNDGKTFTITDVGKFIKNDYTPQEQPWLLLLCIKLQEEGLIVYTIDKGNITLELPE